MPVVLATELKNQFIKGDAKGYMTQNLFFSAHHSLFVCHSSQPQKKKEFSENNAKNREDQATKMLGLAVHRQCCSPHPGPVCVFRTVVVAGRRL